MNCPPEVADLDFQRGNFDQNVFRLQISKHDFLRVEELNSQHHLRENIRYCGQRHFFRGVEELEETSIEIEVQNHEEEVVIDEIAVEFDYQIVKHEAMNIDFPSQ